MEFRWWIPSNLLVLLQNTRFARKIYVKLFNMMAQEYLEQNEDQRHPFLEQIAQWSSRMLANAPAIKAIFWRWKTIKLHRDCKYLISFGIWAAQTLLPYTPPGAPRLLTKVTAIARSDHAFHAAPGNLQLMIFDHRLLSGKALEAPIVTTNYVCQLNPFKTFCT